MTKLSMAVSIQGTTSGVLYDFKLMHKVPSVLRAPLMLAVLARRQVPWCLAR